MKKLYWLISYSYVVTQYAGHFTHISNALLRGEIDEFYNYNTFKGCSIVSAIPISKKQFKSLQSTIKGMAEFKPHVG